MTREASSPRPPASRLYTSSPAARTAREKGIPTHFERTSPTPIGTEFTLPSGVTVNAAKFDSFTAALSDFEKAVNANPGKVRAAVKELGQRLLDMHVSEQQAMRDELAKHYEQPHQKRWDQTRQAWREDFERDPDIGKNRRNTTVARAKAFLAAYGAAVGEDRLARLRDVLTHTGAGDNAEVLRFINWAASRAPKAA